MNLGSIHPSVLRTHGFSNKSEKKKVPFSHKEFRTPTSGYSYSYASRWGSNLNAGCIHYEKDWSRLCEIENK